MYKVYIGTSEITNIYDSTQTITDAKLRLKVNDVGSLSFTIMRSHFAYDLIKPLTTWLTVKRKDAIIFRGRVISINPVRLDGRKTVEVEGKMAVLNDTFIEPFTYTGSIMGYLTKIITEHNSRVDGSRQISVGNVTVTDPNNTINRSSINYLSSWDALNTRLVDLLGGYLIVRYTEIGTIIDYLADSVDKTNQNITLGQNLIEHETQENALELITALLPLGARIPDVDGAQTENRQTVEYVNEGSKVIYNADAVAKYGYIYGVKTWDDIEVPRNLLNTARKYLNDRVALGTSMKVSAIDLSSINVAMDDLAFFSYVTVINPLYEVTTEVLITEKTIDLTDPTKNTITLGSDDTSMTKNNMMMSEMLSNINNSYITSSAVQKENVWMEWLSLDLEGSIMNILFNKEYKTRPAVTFDFSGKSSTFAFDYVYTTEDAEGVTLFTGVALTIPSGNATIVNMVVIGRY